MGQIFKERADTLARLLIAAVILLVAGFVALLYALDVSSYNTKVGLAEEQPVPFSHEHHVGGLGIDCRYCHQSVEVSSNAGMPAAEVCMSCHAQIWNQADMLAPIRESYDKGTPIFWRRVYDLPDFTYFNHSIHVAKGIGCESCHGRVDQMPLLVKATSLKMGWCLDCHRHPEEHVRPLSAITSLGWHPPAGEDAKAYRLAIARSLQVKSQTDCYSCHR